MLIFSAFAFEASAQDAPYKYDIGASLGMSGYLGNANRSSIFKHPGFNGNIVAAYLPNVRWAFRAVLGVTTLSGNTADMQNYLPEEWQNYSFKSTVFSLDVRAEFNFLPFGIGETYKRLSRWSPYLTLGVGGCMSRCDGATGFAPTLPMGGGVKFKANQRLNLFAEFVMTKAFGSKIDNIVDPYGIKMAFYKNTDWFSRINIGLTFEFGERCQTCHYQD